MEVFTRRAHAGRALLAANSSCAAREQRSPVGLNRQGLISRLTCRAEPHRGRAGRLPTRRL